MAKNITKLKHRTPFRQLRQIPRFFRITWPFFALVIITSLLSFLNYEPGTFLIGWDNLNPEFDTWMNFKRSIFSVWQEYRGLGLLAGQAHAADLPRIILILVLEFFKTPVSLIRYLTTFLPLVLGPLGVYFLFYHHLFREKLDAKTTQFASFLGALFYLLNLNTLQTFIVPFETFTWFYGVFPWLLFFTISYLSRPSMLKLSTLFFVSFFAAPAFYVETIYLVFFVSMLPFFIEYFSQQRHFFKSLKTFSLGVSSLIIPQLFWLLPIIFFVFTGSHVAENAKVNQISSPETFYRNLEFANFLDIALIKGYLFNYLDMGAGYKYDYLLSVWRSHLNTPLISLLGYLIFGVIITGLYYSLKKKFAWTASFICVLFLCFFFLLGGGLIINQSFPLIGELFRSPFTKFSIPLSLAYSFFFAIGTIFILDLFTYLHSRLTYLLTLFSVTVALLLFMSPAFSGNLISRNMRVSIPQEYFDLFAYLKTQDPSARIANFPQYTFWGWNYYDWGYRGSGFLWHGLRQPLLDRAFDVWDISSEKYYEEISTAIYSQNQVEFEKLIDKYAISWILLDKHVISPDGRTDLGNEMLESFLSSSRLKLEKNFNNQIFLYKTDIDKKIQNFISATPSQIEKTRPQYPFTSLSLRPNSDWTEKGDFLSISVPSLSAPGSVISLPSLTNTENLLPVKIDYQKSEGVVNLRLTPITPIFFADNQQIDLHSTPISLSLAIPPEDSFVLQIDKQYYLLQLPAEVSVTSGYTALAEAYVPSRNSFRVSLYSISQASFSSLTTSLSQVDPVQCYTEKPNRKIEKIISPAGISLLGTDVNGCLSVPLPITPIDSLISYTFIYSSPSLITGSVNVSGKDFYSPDIALPLEPSTTPKKTTLFTHSTGNYQQLNLVLEAEDTKSVQEITYRDISISIHPQIFSTMVQLPEIPPLEYTLKQPADKLQVSLPLTATQYDILQTPQANSLFPENRNCDQFRDGKTAKIVNEDGFFYQSQNAIECDYLNLRHLPHSLNYLFSFNARNERGLSLTTCLENYSTRRCDFFERLRDDNDTLSIINPITNTNETPGYTLHLINQSFGSRITSNLLKSISIRPIPLTFLKNISITEDQSLSPELSDLSSSLTTTHPYEFLYTVVTGSTEPSILNLYQTRSPYWKALKIAPEDLNLPPHSLALKIFLNYPSLPKIDQVGSEWHNTYAVKDVAGGNQPMVFVYLPQYLEFIGFVLIPVSLFILLTISIFKTKKKTSR